MRRTDLIVVDHVAVSARHGTEARIEMQRHLLCPGNAYVRRQVHVRAHDPCMHAARNGRIEMHYLTAGVDQRIRAPRAAERDTVATRDLGQRCLK